MKLLTSFNYHDNPNSEQLDIILQGGSYGIESTFIRNIYDNSVKKGNSVIAFNFPYYERGEESSSGPELKEELNALQNILDYSRYKEYKHVRLIAKSLGGIVASYYLSNLSQKDMNNFSVVVLGYIAGQTKLKQFNGPIKIIQGEKDKFGGIDVVKEDMKSAVSKEIQFIEIPNADHSYREMETKEPRYEKLAISKIN